MAARKSPLRAVGANEKPPAPKKIRTITEAAEAGDQRELLVAMRRRVAETVQDPSCPPRDLAALSRRLQELSREIEAIDVKVRQEAEEDGGSATPDEEWDEEAI